MPHARDVMRNLIVATLLTSVAAAPVPADTDRFDAALDELTADLEEARQIESTLRLRRAIKNIIRDADRLAERHADSPKRFGAYALMLAAQRELLLIRNDDEVREDLLATCRVLSEAPDAYAQPRLRAEFLISQLELDAQGATEHRRAVALAELADRYRGTSAELDSLMLASEVAFNLGEQDLVAAFRHTLATQFSKDLRAIEFLKERFAQRARSMVFRGHFKRADGETLVFPIDRLGRVYMTCFWSTDTPRLAERFAEIEALRAEYNRGFEVISFNLDELPDAGASILKSAGLDWPAMHLPGGFDNAMFRAFDGKTNFFVRMVNLNGYMTLLPINPASRGGSRIKDLADYVNINAEIPPYLAMFQSLRAAEFLVVDPVGRFDPPAGRVPGESLKAIQRCFVAPPLRYRQSDDETARRFARCVKLCDGAIARHPDADNLWFVYNRRIIALIGLWQHHAEPRYLRQAVVDAKTVLNSKAPESAKLPAQFCLAMAALRDKPDDAERIARSFVAGLAGEVSSMQLATAVVLALNGVERNSIADLRESLLRDHMGDPRVWSLASCLHDRGTYRRLFRANSWIVDVMKRHGMRWYGGADPYGFRFDLDLQTLGGKPLALPDGDPENLNVAVLMAPPLDEQAAADQKSLADRLKEHLGPHLHRNYNLVAVFVRGEPDAIRRAAGAMGWPGSIAVVPGGLSNPGVLRLGVFAADRRPNTFLVRPDGTIWWVMTGMNHHTTSTNAVAGVAAGFVRELDIEIGERALRSGDYDKALKMLSGSFPSSRFHKKGGSDRQVTGRMQAYVAKGDHAAARAELDQLIARHEAEATRRVCGCGMLADLLAARAELFDALDEAEAAKADRARVAALTCPPAGRQSRAGVATNHRQIHRELLAYAANENRAAALEYLSDIIARGEDGRQPERNQLAERLNLRATMLTRLGEAAAAATDRLRGEALIAGIAAPESDEPTADERVRRYVDLLE